MMGCVALSSIVFFDAMYDDMVLSRSACWISVTAGRQQDTCTCHLGGRLHRAARQNTIAIVRICKPAGEFAPAPS
jgi:hypothetical protein